MIVCMYVCMYVCIFIKLHITAQSGPVIRVILCRGGTHRVNMLSDAALPIPVCMYVCMYIY